MRKDGKELDGTLTSLTGAEEDNRGGGHSLPRLEGEGLPAPDDRAVRQHGAHPLAEQEGLRTSESAVRSAQERAQP